MKHDKKDLSSSNEASLESIEQLQDRSHLSAMYPKAKKQWTGELMSTEARETKRDAHIEQISRSIRRYFFSIGFLIPLPIFLFALFGVASQFFVKDAIDLAKFIIPMIFALLLLAGLTFLSLKKVRKTFYDHAILIGPFYLTLVLLLIPVGVISYVTTLAIHGNQIIPATLTVGAIGIIASVTLSFFLLFIWTTPHLNGRGKMTTILLTGGTLVIAAAACVAVHLVNHLS